MLDKIFLLDSAKQTLKQLPLEPWKRETKSSRSGIKYIIVISGKRSQFRISPDEQIAFVYRPFPTAQTNVEHIQLYAMDSGGKDRTFVTRAVKGRSDEQNPSIPLDVVKSGTSSYKLTPPGSHLGSGEYCMGMLLPQNSPVPCFGVN